MTNIIVASSNIIESTIVYIDTHFGLQNDVVVEDQDVLMGVSHAGHILTVTASSEVHLFPRISYIYLCCA